MRQKLKSRFAALLLVMLAGVHAAGNACAENYSPMAKVAPNGGGNGKEGEDGKDRSADGNNSEGGGVANTPSGFPQSKNIDSQPNHSGAISRLPALDQEQTKLAIDTGRAVSLTLLLTYIKLNYPGDVLDVKLHTNDSKLVYEVRYLSNVIFLRTVYLDAQTLKVQ